MTDFSVIPVYPPSRHSGLFLISSFRPIPHLVIPAPEPESIDRLAGHHWSFGIELPAR